MKCYVYIMTNRKDGVLYTGVTNDIIRRIFEHKEGMVDGFTKKYHLHQLVYYEIFNRIEEAIKREKQIKNYQRIWKVELIENQNPKWKDLYSDLV